MFFCFVFWNLSLHTLQIQTTIPMMNGDGDDETGQLPSTFIFYSGSRMHCLKENETSHRTMHTPSLTLMVIVYNLLLVDAMLGD